MSMPAIERAAGEAGESYYDPRLQAEVIKLLPADYVVTSRQVAIVTLLGSCVAACLYDPDAAIGGMNHFMLPDGDASGDAPARYGVHAMELLINALLKHGARRTRLVAKVFGGGNVLRGFQAEPVGTRNARFVLEYLATERIPVLALDLGDVHPRKVGFFPRSGRTLVRRLPATREREITDIERAYRGHLREAPVRGSVELF